MTIRTFLFHKYQNTISQNPPNNINFSMGQHKKGNLIVKYFFVYWTANQQYAYKTSFGSNSAFSKKCTNVNVSHLAALKNSK